MSQLSATPASSDSDLDALLAALAQLPPLPSILRYWDDFDEQNRDIPEFNVVPEIPLHRNGLKTVIDLRRLSDRHALLLKHLAWYLFSSDLRPSTVAYYLDALRAIPLDDVARLVSDPTRSKRFWRALRASSDNGHRLRALKAMLRFCCDQYLCGWNPDYFAYIESEFPLPKAYPYETVESGDAFLEEDDERRIVAFFDSLSAAVDSGGYVDARHLESAAIVMCAYQFGMRPIQIASLRLDDVKDWSQSLGDDAAVHVRFMMAKQRSSEKVLYLPRKVKQEWSSIWRALILHAPPARKRFFDVTSSAQVATTIIQFCDDAIGIRASANTFRHSAAQRLVEAGASNEELAAFMGHVRLATGLVYYRTSAHQAELVNRALGLSPVYQRLRRIAHAKFISSEELAELKGEQQIGGVPHGVPLSGIGGCASGQPNCPFNPVTSCYGCGRFMPVVDVAIHENVLDELRKVARFFFDQSKGEASSPAYMQLRRTITSIECILDELQERSK